MDIYRCGSKPSQKGDTTHFTGTVRVDRLYEGTAPARARASSVTFEPGARTGWHKHPFGQALIVTGSAVSSTLTAWSPAPSAGAWRAHFFDWRSSLHTMRLGSLVGRLSGSSLFSN